MFLTDFVSDLSDSLQVIDFIKVAIMELRTLISVKQLANALTKFPKPLRILDSSWHLKSKARDPFTEFVHGHIPEAQFFDLEECRDKTSKYDFMLPSRQEFENYVGRLGINNDTHVVLYENNESGFYSSPRAWWTFRVFGHHSVSLLDGGFPRWLAEGRRSSKDLYSVDKQTYKAYYDTKMVKTLDDILQIRKDGDLKLVDARPLARFDGTEDEPSGRCGVLCTALGNSYAISNLSDLSRIRYYNRSDEKVGSFEDVKDLHKIIIINNKSINHHENMPI